MQDLHVNADRTDAQIEKTTIDVQRLSNAVEALRDTIAHHDTRLNNIEDGGEAVG